MKSLKLGPVTICGAMGRLVSADCESDDARFHVWIDRHTLKIEEGGVLYKNPKTPMVGISGHTRHLDPTKGTSKIIADHLLAGAPDAMPAFLAEENAEKERMSLENRERRRKQLIIDASPDAHQLILNLNEFMRHWNSPDPSAMFDENRTWKQAVEQYVEKTAIAHEAAGVPQS